MGKQSYLIGAATAVVAFLSLTACGETDASRATSQPTEPATATSAPTSPAATAPVAGAAAGEKPAAVTTVHVKRINATPARQEKLKDVKTGKYHHDVWLLTAGGWRNLTRFKDAHEIQSMQMSDNGAKVLVWHKDRSPWKVSIYDAKSMALLTRWSPGFGGYLSWTPGENIVHIWGCGTNCQMFRVYNAKGKTLLEEFCSGNDLSPNHRYLVTFPSLAYGEDIVIRDLATLEVLHRSATRDVICDIRWAEDSSSVTILREQVRTDDDSKDLPPLTIKIAQTILPTVSLHP